VSSTNRGSQRSPADYYATPEWCVWRLLEEVGLPGGCWIEPAAGDGAIIRAVGRNDVVWDAWEIRSSEGPVLRACQGVANVHLGDFFEGPSAGRAGQGRYDVAITNPPFRLAQEFIEASMSMAETTVMLLRLNFLASKARWEFMRKHAPDVYVLPTRPSFVNGKTDSVEYAWFVWTREPRREGRIKVLGLRSDPG